MRKMMSAALAAMMMVSLAACVSTAPAPAETTAAPATEAATTAAPETEAATEAATEAETEAETEAAAAELTTVEDGKLTVAMSPDFAPYEFYAIGEDGTPTLAGFDVSLAEHIADHLGLELEIIPMDFDGTIMELSQHNVDLGISGYSPSPDRADVMDFSDIYYTGGQSFVCLQANKDKFTSLEDTNKADLTVGAQVGSIQADLAKENSPEADLIQMAKVTDLIAEVLNGKMDGAYIETLVAESYARNYPDLCVVLPVPYDQEGSVVGVNKGNEALLAGVNEAIQECLANGQMEDWVAKANELASGEIFEGMIEE